MHSCIFQQQRVIFTYGAPQFLVRCRCHEDSWHTWRIGDGAYICQVSHVAYEVDTNNGDEHDS